MKKSLVFVAVLIVFAACTNEGSSGTGDQAPSDESSPTPTPALSTEDAAEIEDVIREYFGAFGDVRARARTSTGDLAAWATWLSKIELLDDVTEEKVVINRLDVNEDESSSDTAEVDFKAKWTEVVGDGSLAHDLAGPVEVLRTSNGWKLSDYVRDGRSQKEAVFARVRGTYQESSGVIVRVLGAVLQNNYVSVFVTFENRADAGYQPFSASLVTDTGQQLSEGTFAGPSEIFPGAKVTGQFLWETDLPLKTRSLRLIIDGSETVNFADRGFDLNLRMK